MTDTPNRVALNDEQNRTDEVELGEGVFEDLGLFTWPLWVLREVSRTKGIGGVVLKLLLVAVLCFAYWVLTQNLAGVSFGG